MYMYRQPYYFAFLPEKRILIYYHTSPTSPPKPLQLQMQNEHEERSIDAIFAEKQSRESEIRVLEEAVESERRAKETVVSGMQPHELEQYRRLKAENIRVEKVSAESTRTTLNCIRKH